MSSTSAGQCEHRVFGSGWGAKMKVREVAIGLAIVLCNSRLLASDLSELKTGGSQILIASNSMSADPLFVLGAVTHLKEGKITFDNFAKDSAIPSIETKNDVIYSDLIQSEDAASIEALAFLKASVSANMKAEVVISRTMVCKILKKDFDFKALSEYGKRMSGVDQLNTGVIVAVTQYVVTTNFYKEDSGEVSGLMVTAGGKKYKKNERNSSSSILVATVMGWPELVGVNPPKIEEKTALSDLIKTNGKFDLKAKFMKSEWKKTSALDGRVTKAGSFVLEKKKD